MFGINDRFDLSTNQVAKLVSRLRGADYIFFDEISMVSCRDLYQIHHRLVQIKGNAHMPFGGSNLIFSGDFAQLPPTIGGENVALYTRTAGLNRTTARDQEMALGKALWHQITTVVILQQNMRQKSQTEQDSKFRTALENMRYKRCTPEDIVFLRSRISSGLSGRPCVTDIEFRNVAIITANNVEKDAINATGCRHYAHETNQRLTDFFSEDSISGTSEDDNVKGRKIAGKALRSKHGVLTDTIRDALWNQPHCMNDAPISPQLSLAVGMPVMIRTNIATELCMMRGQEGVVYSWQAAVGSRGQKVLETLFIKLRDPPTTVKFDGLPENVVPLIRSTNPTRCTLPDDQVLAISRTQVEVLPCFAMTEYASQGKTRVKIVVDLNNTRSHQGFYTALSRGTSADGTLILQGFDTSKITGGASGALRQEFRELELLDEITRLRYEGKLPKSVNDDNKRSTLINAIRAHRGQSYVPKMCHPAIRWNKKDEFLGWTLQDVDWQSVPSKKGNFGKAEKAQEPQVSKKEYKPHVSKSNVNALPGTPSKKRAAPDGVDTPPAKRLKTDQIHGAARSPSSDNVLLTPVGSQLRNNSCAYDAITTILFDLWKRTNANSPFDLLNSVILKALFQDFALCSARHMDIDDARDNLRKQLNNLNAEKSSLKGYASVYTSSRSCLRPRTM